jgi:hypothetical protein
MCCTAAAIRTRSRRCRRPRSHGKCFSWWLLLKVFSSGCTAMTGVEAVSNGVMAFRDDTRKNAKITLTIIIVLLACCCSASRCSAAPTALPPPTPTARHYESVLSMLTRAVMGHGWFYYVTIASVLLVLALSANTAFADFPRLTRAIALDDYMPHVFLLRGRRLLYSWGIYVLVALTACCSSSSAASPTGSFRSTPSARSGLHALAGRHGDALEAPGVARGACRQRPGRAGHRHHHPGGAGGQVCPAHGSPRC